MAVINIETAASSGSRVAGRGVGSAIGAAASSPAGFAIIAITGLIIAAVIFKKDIGTFFSNLNPFKDFEFPEFKFPTFENPFADFKFPTFEFPEFKNPFEDFEFPELPDFTSIFAGFQEQLDNFEFPTLPALFKDEDEPTTAGAGGGFGNDPRRQSTFNRDESGILSQDEINNLRDIDDEVTDLTPTQRFNFIERGVIPTGFIVVDGELTAETPTEIFASPNFETTRIESNLQTGFEAFQVGDSGFVGAAINPTPIGNLSLSQIIDKFNVTASQAANIKAIANDDFGDFDFGTNTGGGIGSIIPSISSLVGGSGLNVSSNQFEGLSAEQIANFLTGGNISNF